MPSLVNMKTLMQNSWWNAVGFTVFGKAECCLLVSVGGRLQEQHDNRVPIDSPRHGGYVDAPYL